MLKISSHLGRACPIFLLLMTAACGSGSGGSIGAGDSPPASNPPSSTPIDTPVVPATPAETPTDTATPELPATESPPPDAGEADPPVTDAAPPVADAAFAVIRGVSFNTSSRRRAAVGSDNWPVTWSNDGHQYGVWGDGGGFGGAENVGRASLGIARIEGDSHNYRGVNRFGGKDAHCRSTITGKGHGAPISIRGVLYVWITPGAGAQGYDSFTLYRSTNKGCNWTRLGVSFVRTRDKVSYGSFVQFGRDNTAARDAYVYTVATEIADTSSLLIVQRPGRVMLIRVPAASITDRGTYQFYAGRDSSGEPLWTKNPANRRAIYQDSAGVGPFPQMTFVPGLDRMVYTNQHGNGSNKAGSQSLLTMAEAAQPWGPWHVFHRARFLASSERTVFQWNFAPKWFRNGGRDFTLIYSGIDDHDSWNTINGSFAIQ
jgi:hypothetical protein